MILSRSKSNYLSYIVHDRLKNEAVHGVNDARARTRNGWNGRVRLQLHTLRRNDIITAPRWSNIIITSPWLPDA